MDLNLLIGVVALSFGLTTLVGRFVAPDSRLFSKLAPMKERLGDGPGTFLHVLSYTVIPLAVGATLLTTWLWVGAP